MSGTSRFGNPAAVPDPTASGHATPRDWVLARSLPIGGAVGELLYKQSDSDYDGDWAIAPPVSSSAIDADFTSDASVGGNYRDVDVIVSAITIGVPTNPTNRQTIEYAFYASTATTVTFNSSIRLSTGLVSRSFDIGVDEILYAAVKYSSLQAAWSLVAATVTAV